MFDSRVLEVLIASDDHRVLSANAEAWWLVQNDVFVAFESFLTEESKQEFTRHLQLRDQAWFLMAFAGQPGFQYLTKVFPPEKEGSLTIRVLFTRLDQLMDDYLRANFLLNTYDTMLALYDDLYYEYIAEADTISLFNADQSRYTKSTLPLDDFRGMLEARCTEEAKASLDVWMKHLRGGTPRFRVRIPCNLFNEDSGIHAVQVKGNTAHHRDNKKSLIGLMHPLMDRGTTENRIAYDSLTGAVDKEHITRMAVDRIDRLHAEGTAIAIVDLDYFKHINDSFGHLRGDEILRQVASIMETEIKDGGAVGRIGGDEFMLVFNHVANETELRAYLRSIKGVITATMDQVTVSIGAAVYPDDAACYQDVFLVADYCLYLAKEKGRNRYIIHTLAKHPPLEKIRKLQSAGDRSLIKGRDDLPLGDVLVQMQYLVRYGKKPPLPQLLNEFALRAGLPLVSLWRRSDQSLILAAGKEKTDVDTLRKFLETHRLDDLWLPRNVRDGMSFLNNASLLTDEDQSALREALLELNLMSCFLIPVTGSGGQDVMMVFASVNRSIFWNEQHYMYYRLFADLLSAYELS